MVQAQDHRILVASGGHNSGEKLLTLLSEMNCMAEGVSTHQEAKQRLKTASYSLLIVNAPLLDAFGTKLLSQADSEHMGSLIFVPQEEYETRCQSLNPHGVLVLPKSTNVRMIRQAIHLLLATREQLLLSQKQMQEKLDEVRILNRAKLVLMERLCMRESEAHHYIEKQAMSTCRKRRTEIGRAHV